MVTALYGKCNGQEIVFSYDEALGHWNVSVPASGRNEYVIELLAADDAGNTAYFATIKVTCDTATLCTKFEILELGTGIQMEDVIKALAGDGIQTAVWITDVRQSVTADNILSNVVKCEVCGL